MINAIKNGDAAAFEQVYIQYRRKLFAYFLKKTNAEEDAKDLLQTTFFKLWQYRRSLCEDYLLEQHLFHIAGTVFIDYLRRENKMQKIKASVKLQTNINQSAEQLHQYDLQAKLSDMPLQRRLVFELHKIEGYSYKEISCMLSISVKAVDNNLAKAMKYLRNTELLIIILLLQFFS
jgi:RNA polymerase sigma factor (sigma-70 family)